MMTDLKGGKKCQKRCKTMGMLKQFVQNTQTPNKHPNKTSLRVKACSNQ